MAKRGAGTRAAVALTKQKAAARREPEQLLIRLDALADEIVTIMEEELLMARMEALADEIKSLITKPTK